MYSIYAAALVGALATSVAAQTSTTCNPLNATCPADAALGTTYNQTFTAAMSKLDSHYWDVEAGSTLIGMTDNGATFNIEQQGDSVTIKSAFYIFWGRVEVVMKAAAGTGIISTMNLLSDDLDEIDWEIMGGNVTHAETNYFGHGNTSQQFAQYYPVNGGTTNGFHTYAVDWNKDRLQWLIDGQVVRTEPAGPSGIYPQTPSFIKLGIWAAGAPGQPKGTVEWAGGQTDFKKAPFVMTVQSVKVIDGSTNSSSYVYGDNSGAYQSIQIKEGVSKAAAQISKAPTESMTDKFNKLPTAAKAGIGAGIAVALVSILFIWGFCWRRQRKIGRDERRAADEKLRLEREAQNSYQMNYQYQMKNGGFARHSQIMS